ncbi:MAG: bacterioferritin [Planctomycetes bacterium]|nr:bacterioferritin [Planctomycetota bacterium]
MPKQTALPLLNELLEHELAGVVRYTHYSFMVFGHGRIPIINWLRDKGMESLTHAQEIGELITALGGHPSLKIKPLLETHKHSVDDILQESLAHEKEQLEIYRQLYEASKDKSVLLEEFARNKICEEETHAADVEKMLKKSL